MSASITSQSVLQAIRLISPKCLGFCVQEPLGAGDSRLVNLRQDELQVLQGRNGEISGEISDVLKPRGFFCP